MWVSSRETHPGPHSAWFWDAELAGGGCIVDLGCHCIEIIRNYVGKTNRPVEVMCWSDTLVHPIDAEDNAIALIRFESGAIGQFEVSWTFRGGMDLRDEVAGTEGTIWTNHFLRTGFEMFSSGEGGYVAEKAETESGWLFPVGDEIGELGYVEMFTDMFDAIDQGREPVETFYDGYVVNAVMDACFRSSGEPPVGAGRARLAPRCDRADRPHGTDRGRADDHQGGAPPRRAPQADPQGPGDGRVRRPCHLTRRHAAWCVDDRWVERVADALLERLSARPTLRMCLATGSTPLPVYERVASAPGAFAARRCLLLDEFGGLPPRRAGALRRRAATQCSSITSHRPTTGRSTWTPTTSTPSARRSTNGSMRGGLDLAVLGLGVNGHLGMNEPGAPGRPHGSRRARRRRRSRARSGTSPDGIDPTWGVTVGLRDLLRPARSGCSPPVPTKADIVARSLQGRSGRRRPGVAAAGPPELHVVARPAGGSDLEM